MQTTEVLPAIAGLLFVASSIHILRRVKTPASPAWLVPATLSALFLGLSIWTQAVEGPFGFWTEHTRNLWGNQIWLDLLLAVTIGWMLVLPRAKATGMRLGLWLVFIICTGSIGFTAMIARLIFLEGRAQVRR